MKKENWSTKKIIYTRNKDNVKKTTYKCYEKFYNGCHSRILTEYTSAEPAVICTAGSHAHVSSNAEN